MEVEESKYGVLGRVDGAACGGNTATKLASAKRLPVPGRRAQSRGVRTGSEDRPRE